jgi:hypothetical protein
VAFSSRFLVKNLPSGPDLRKKFMDASCAWNCVHGKFMLKFSLTL